MLTTAGCTALPSSGPSRQDVASNATVKNNLDEKKSRFQYALLDVNSSVLPYFDYSVYDSLFKGFGMGNSKPSTDLGAGDVIQITIFEAQAGGLFIPAGATTTQGNFVTLPKQTIDGKGEVIVPYAGPVKVTGRSVAAVQAEIAKKLSNRAIEPQVVITTVSSASQNLSILGDVNQPAQMAVSTGDRVLDIISKAGGLSAPSIESYVTLERNGKKATALFKSVVSSPRENIFVHPNDTIYVERERRTYLAFGATGASGQYNFEEANLTLGQALAKAGGLLDGRADPSQVLLYREVPRKTLVELGLDVSRFSGDMIQTVFKANLRDPSMLFAVQKFKMRDRDIIYVTNSDSVEITKFMNLVNGVSDTHSNVVGDLVTTKNAAKALGQ
ncbi:polysaccharide biosynthesis/export family protein [Rhizobium sp. C1]|uniref:polysaccharide biosynthesis/export family protein n=1 Tax=Rhizobium sp. C1 TaxID=1349799 RepID=UPI001E3AFA43|nr:polysaccharide biosynthesis/export family protein [Rhizobium sp. C1]MCD2178059.1 polysaccharide export protein [Rhizobium sp. C1]